MNCYIPTPNPLLDGHLMNTLFRAIDEPIRASGVTAHTLVNYTNINDPTRWQSGKLPKSAVSRVMIDPRELIDTCYKLVPHTATPPPSQAGYAASD